jgi:acetyl esterase/lipase
MRKFFVLSFAVAVIPLLASRAHGEEIAGVLRTEDVVYGRKDGMALTLDVFQAPQANQCGIIFLVNGGWFSSKSTPRMQNITPEYYTSFLDRGYTVFAIVTSSQPKYTIPDLISDSQRAVRFVRANAPRFGLDPQRLGITGSSSGGHLTLAVATMGGQGDPDAPDPVDRESSTVQAAACFFPPTDFLNYGGPGISGVGLGPLRPLQAAFGPQAETEEGRQVLGKAISPIYFVTANLPPTLIIHGDMDEVVPLQQSESFVERAKLAKAKSIDLVIRPGKTHGWPKGSIVWKSPEDMQVFLDWFDRHLLPKQRSEKAEFRSKADAVAAADDSAGITFFEKEVRPLLVKRCYACHAGTKAKGGLSLETANGWKVGGESGPAIRPGRTDESLLIDAINYKNLEMPPPEKGRLTDGEIAILTKWVAMGAPDPRDGRASIGGMTQTEAKSWWAFQPLPVEKAPAESGHIDRLLQRELDQHRFHAGPPADKRTLVRRATYNLTGLPPTAEEVDAFLADDSQNAYEKVVERLLESPQYGVHWGRHWLDVVRYADTAGENTDRPLPHAWRYRNWVLDAFQRDMPFDRFVHLQLAGDILSADRSGAERTAGIVATGYLAIARRFGHDIDKDMYLTYEDVIDNLGKNFLGLSFGCARCHDHKYDPVSAEDYYALYGIFESTKFAFPGCEPKGQPRDLVPLIDKQEVERLTTAYQQQLAAFEERGQATAREVQRLKQVAGASMQVLAESAVGEGQSVAIQKGREDQLNRLGLRKGEVLQLTVMPNANHGADTTRIELEISLQDTQTRRVWNPEALLERFTRGGPAIDQDGATWCLLDVTDGPVFLREKKENINGKPVLKGWAIGDTPSSFVNAGPEPVEVWTKLPPRAFFVHPGPGRNVAVAWVCPEDGVYQVRGTVTDAHPAGLDGVHFRLEHFASPELGAGLIALGARFSADPPRRPDPPAFPVAYAVVEAKEQNARLQLRGDPEKPGDESPRHWLTVFGGEPVPPGAGSGRRHLGDWIARHPLTARVMVNRIWQGHFGRGLVGTPNDLGARGDKPTHPELLDWLAAQFVETGYSVKAMHRLILHSAAWKRASASPDAADPDNRWFAHFARRRLTAEELRDSLLAVSGQLDLTPAEGHPFPPEATWNFTQHDPFNAMYETNRRSAFLMVQRQRRHHFLSLFDGADPNASTPGRQATTVPTQALYFINDGFFHAQAEKFAAGLTHLASDDKRITHAYRTLFQREPSAPERERWKCFLTAYPASAAEAQAALARVLLASNEFLHID